MPDKFKDLGPKCLLRDSDASASDQATGQAGFLQVKFPKFRCMTLLSVQVNELGFKPEFLGRLSLVSAISSLAGIILYDQKLKRVPLKEIFKWTVSGASG